MENNIKGENMEEKIKILVVISLILNLVAFGAIGYCMIEINEANERIDELEENSLSLWDMQINLNEDFMDLFEGITDILEIII